MSHSTRTSRLRTLGMVILTTAIVGGPFLAPVADATSVTLQPTSVTVSQLTNYSGIDGLSNCNGGSPPVVNSSSSPGDYSEQNNTNPGTTTGDASGGLQYSFSFPVAINHFNVTLTAPAPAEPAGVPRGVYGTTFPPAYQHVDQGIANSDYGCNASDFTVYNYAIALTINGENWLYTPDGVVLNSAQNEVTIPIELPGTSATITNAVGVQNGGGPSGTVTYTCQGGCGFASGEVVSISDLGSASGSSLNLSNVTVANAQYNSFTVNLATAVVGVSKGTGVASTQGIADVTAMTVYVANVINPPVGTYPGFDYTVGVDDLDAGSTNIYSTVPAPASSASLTYKALAGDPLTSSLSISKSSITATNVPSQGATVTATVRDQYWNPVSGETVYVGVQQPLSGAIFTEPETAGTGPGGLPQTGSDGTVQYYAWGTKATATDLPAALFAQATTPDSFYFQEPQIAAVTGATGDGSTVTYAGANTYAPGQSISVSGLPVTGNGDAPTGGVVTSANATSFTVSESGVYGSSTGNGVATAAGLDASNLTASSNGSVVTVNGANEFSSGQVVVLQNFSFASLGGGTLPPSIGVVLSAGNSYFTVYLLFPFFGGAWPSSVGNGTSGMAYTSNQVEAATVTAATGTDGADITYTANNDFTDGQSVNVEGLGTASGSSLNIQNFSIGSATGDQFTALVPPALQPLTGVSSGTGIATASGPVTVSMAVDAASPSAPSAGLAFNGLGSSVHACPGGSTCSISAPVATTIEVGNGTSGGTATVTVQLVDQFGNFDTDRAVELSPLQPSSGPSENFKDLSITPLDPATNTSLTTECDQGPAADLPGISCTDDAGTTSFLVSDARAQSVSFQIVDATDGFTMPTTDLPPTDVPNIPVVTFTTGPLDASHSSVTVNGGASANVPANNTSYGTIAVSLHDQFGNPEPGESVTLTGSTGAATSIPAASGDGTTVTYLAPGNTFTAGETVSITGLNSPFDLTDVTIASATSSQFTVQSAVDGVATGTGLATPGEHDEICAVASSTATTCASPAQPATTDANGNAWFHVRDGNLETVTYTASADGTPIPSAGQPVVNYVTGQVSYSNSTVVVSPSTVVGNGRGTATVTATVVNTGGHPLAGVTVALNPGDNATVTAASSGASTVTYTAVNNFTAGQLVSIVGLGTLSGSSLDVSDQTIVSANATSFTVDDPAVANSVALGSGTATLDYSNLTIVPPVAQTNANGQATFAVTAGAFDGSVTLPTNVLVPVDVSPAPLNGNTPVPSPLTANVSFAPTPTTTSVVAAPEPSTATVTSATGDGTTATYNVTYPGATTFAPGQVVTISGLPATTGASLNLTNVVIATTTSTTFTVRSTLVGTSAGGGSATSETPVATGSNDESITATVLDGTNPATDGIANLSLELVTSNGGPPLATGVTNSLGQYTFQASLAPGLPLGVSYIVKDLSDGGRVVGTAAVTYVPAANEADESMVSALPVATYTYDPAQESAHADQQTSVVTVHLVDGSGAPIVGNDVALTAYSQPSNTASTTAVVTGDVSGGTTAGVSVSDANGVATFDVTDTSPEEVSFEAEDLGTSTSLAAAPNTTVTFVLRPDESTESTVSASPTVVEANGLQSATVTVTLLNHGLPVTGSLVSLSQGSGASIITSANPVSNLAGVATFTVTDLTPQPVVYEATDLTTATTIVQDAIVTFTAPPGGTLRPSVTSIAPASGSGTGGTLVTITGTNLLGASAVDFGAVPSPTYSVNLTGTSLTAYSPIPVAEGSVNVVVVGPGGASADSSADIYTYTSAPPLDVSTVSPAFGSLSGGTSVIIAGTGLEDALAVHFGSVSARFVVSDGGRTLTAVAPSVTTPGIEPVTVVTAHGSSAATVTTTFTYLGAAPKAVSPLVAGVTPASGPVTGGSNVTVKGSHFAGVRYVEFGTVKVTKFAVNAAGTILTVKSPAVRASTSVAIVVVTSAGPSGRSRHDVFTYVKKTKRPSHVRGIRA